jgi:hypothetical protein
MNDIDRLSVYHCGVVPYLMKSQYGGETLSIESLSHSGRLTHFAQVIDKVSPGFVRLHNDEWKAEK